MTPSAAIQLDRGIRRAGMITISDDGIYTRDETMQYLRLKPATFSRLTNGKLKSVPRLKSFRPGGRKQLFRGRTIKQWVIDAEAMYNGAP